MAQIIKITDLRAGELDIYARFTENQLLRRDNPAEGIFIAESSKVVLRALEAGYQPVSLLAEDRVLAGEAREVLERCPEIPVYTAPVTVLTELTGYNLTRGLLCAMRRKPLVSVKELCRNARRIALLENVMNPTNVGAIIRSAAALNMDGVLLTLDCSNPLYRRSVRVSMGTVFQIPWTFLSEEECGSWPREGMRYLKSLGFSAAAMALHNESIDIDDDRLRNEKKLAVVLGSEGYGLTDATIGAADYTIKIPMSHGVDSLNVAAASAVAFWELGRGNSQWQKEMG